MRTEISTQPPVSGPAGRLRALAFGLLLALGLSACGTAVGDPQSAAVVNGVGIPLSSVAQRYESVRRDPQLAQQLAADEDGSFKARVQARILTQLIQAELLSQAAREIGIEVTDADIDAERQVIVDQVGGEEAFAQLVEENGLTEADVRGQLRDLVVERRVEETLTEDVEIDPAEVRAFFEENRTTRYDRLRASHILVPTETEARQVLERLAAGEDFAALASELSQDPGSADQGGDLGEFTRGRLVPEFEDAAFGAEVGEVVGPIQTQFGWHVIEITGRDQPTFAEVRDDITEELTQGRLTAVREEFRQTHFGEADVRVNPRLGTWNPAVGEVEAGDPLGDTTPLEPELGLPGQQGSAGNPAAGQ